VYLSDGGSGKRFAGETAEAFSRAKCPCEDGLKIVLRHGRQLVMQLAERLKIRLIKEISPGRKHLGQLDETGPQMLNG